VRPEVDERDKWSIDWRNSGCEQGAQWGARSCPHIEPNWPYTVNDAFSALACQVGGTDGSHVRQLIQSDNPAITDTHLFCSCCHLQGKADPTPENEAIKAAMRKFLNQNEWVSL
jgi:hypothetical protein